MNLLYLRERYSLSKRHAQVDMPDASLQGQETYYSTCNMELKSRTGLISPAAADHERKPRSLPTAFAFLMSAWFIFFGTPTARRTCHRRNT